MHTTAFDCPFRISSDIDDLLKKKSKALTTTKHEQVKPAKPHKPKPAQKPTLPRKPAVKTKPKLGPSGNNDVIDESLDSNDVLKYISDNSSQANDDVDLFS